MAIHKVDDGYVISAYRIWRPGLYDTERAANYAFRFKDEELADLQASIGIDAITFDMLKGYKKECLWIENQ